MLERSRPPVRSSPWESSRCSPSPSFLENSTTPFHKPPRLGFVSFLPGALERTLKKVRNHHRKHRIPEKFKPFVAHFWGVGSRGHRTNGSGVFKQLFVLECGIVYFLFSVFIAVISLPVLIKFRNGGHGARGGKGVCLSYCVLKARSLELP